MKLDFAKMQGLGNDFIVIDDMANELELSTDRVKELCDRHYGIGADGIILVRPPQNCECCAFMHYINSDGSLAQMCGNGIRCLAKYLVDRGYVNSREDTLSIETLAGIRNITYHLEEGRLIDATVDMGCPVFDPKEIPVNVPSDYVIDADEPYLKDMPLESQWGTFTFTCLSMGNPHAVCFIDTWDAFSDELFSDPLHKTLETLNLDLIGAFYETNEAFPEKANIEFAQIEDGCIAMRVYERGCGETLACGTGACATDVAAALTGRTGRENDLVLRGGTLHINWAENGHVMMTGSAAESFTGTVEIAEF